MLAYILALIVGLGSLALYISAFFFPEIHRKNDFIWSGIGLFYGLVLWVFARGISGGLLLGHVASVALLVWFGWQTLSLRRQVTPQGQQTPVPSYAAVTTSIQEQVTKLSFQESLAKLQQSLSGIFGGLKGKVSKNPPTAKPTVAIVDKPTLTPEPPVEEVSVTTDIAPIIETVADVIPPQAESEEQSGLSPMADAPTEETTPNNQAT